jgi:small subunit ribosomal protein S19
MAKKLFTYQGKTLEELQAMSLNDLAELFPSRQRRKMKRGFTVEEKKFLDTITKKNNVKTHLRDMIILPVMIGKTIKIHSGKEFISIIVQEETLGCRLGELVLTRKKTGHSSPGVGATKPSGKVAVK